MRLLSLAIILSLIASFSQAQTSGNLIADRIEILPGGQLLAQGNVVIWQDGARLSASQIEFDGTTNTLRISGPIQLDDGKGVIFLASHAELSQSLKTGILKNARLVLNQQVQLAAAEISRVNGRYTQALKVAATSCQVCLGKTPIWQIRAERIVHDTLEQQLYFEQAQLRVFDVPVFYFPQIRLPDPNLDRATGLLVPNFKNSTALGLGVKLPYFIKLGDHKDLTLSPFMSSNTRTLEFRYRQATQTGEFQFEGAVSRDEILANQTRGYLFGNGTFQLPRQYVLKFDLQAVEDPTYFFDYGYADTDRLKSSIEITRATRTKNVELSFSSYHSLRASDNNAELPTLVTQGIMQQRFFPTVIGGEVDYSISFLGSYRYSDTTILGFDVARVSASTQWSRDYIFRNGMIFDASAKLAADQYSINQHSGFARNTTRTSAIVTAGLGWPLQRRGATHIDVIEPRIQLDWSSANGPSVPNQDSTGIEFDEGNLFSTGRAPGHDVFELGARVNVGLRGQRTYDTGARISWEIGRIYRPSAYQSFSVSSGLSQKTSDWLLGTHVSLTNGFDLIARGMVADSGSIRKAETRVNWHNERTILDATYTWLGADIIENRPTSVSELALNWQVNFKDYWAVSSDLRYDFGVNELAQAGVGLKYENECASVELSVSRRFTSSSTFQPATDFGLTVSLTGYGTGTDTKRPIRKCGA